MTKDDEIRGFGIVMQFIYELTSDKSFCFCCVSVNVVSLFTRLRLIHVLLRDCRDVRAWVRGRASVEAGAAIPPRCSECSAERDSRFKTANQSADWETRFKRGGVSGAGGRSLRQHKTLQDIREIIHFFLLKDNFLFKKKNI